MQIIKEAKKTFFANIITIIMRFEPPGKKSEEKY